MTDFIKSYGELLSFAIILIVCALTFVMTYYMIRKDKLSQGYKSLSEKSDKELLKIMHERKGGILNYDTIDRYIRSSGLAYMTKGRMKPTMFVYSKIAGMLVGLVVGFQLHPVAGVVLSVIGFYGVEIVAKLSDSADNTAMLDDIKSIYDTLRIQTKAGVYISSALTECYLVVKNKRLKQALLELAGDITAKNDVAGAMEEFTGKFNNEYINVLAIIIKQSMQSGQAAKMFDDIKGQINDIDSALAEKERSKIKGRVMFTQMLVYVGIVGAILYPVILTLSSQLSF